MRVASQNGADTRPLIKVLCVDDCARLSAAMERLIGAQPDMRSVGTVCHANELVREVKGRAADIVVLDLTMPGRDPLSAIHELAAACPDVRVIVFSGASDATAVHRAMEAGAWGYASKGAAASTVLSAIRAAARGERARDPITLQEGA
jgi:DNA-binding NarL/FixJ family response regulator